MEEQSKLDFNLVIQELGTKNLEILLLRNQIKLLLDKITELEKMKDGHDAT